MNEFTIKIDNQINELHTHLLFAQYMLKSFYSTDPVGKENFLDNYIAFKPNDEIDIQKNVKKFSSDKVKLLKIAQYCKLKGIYDKLINDRKGISITEYHKTSEVLEPVTVFGYEYFEKEVVTYYTPKSIEVTEFLNVQLKDYKEFKNDIYNLTHHKFFGNASRANNIIFNYNDDNMSALSVKMKMLKPNHKLEIKDLIVKSQFTPERVF